MNHSKAFNKDQSYMHNALVPPTKRILSTSGGLCYFSLIRGRACGWQEPIEAHCDGIVFVIDLRVAIQFKSDQYVFRNKP